ncbi:acyltransferase family protein [Roseomonas haemaphysalidis]|nr:acyltransferase [Roseomonas haemaphysalidis]
MLRGIASLVVVLNHYVQTVPEDIRYLTSYPLGIFDPAAWLTPWPWLRASPFRLLVAGQAAVDLFFVLSGFVLAFSIRRDWQPNTVVFLVKRFCRIYLPFLIVLLMTVGVYNALPIKFHAGNSIWMNEITSNAAASIDDWFSHLLLTGLNTDMRLNPVMWTLVHELRISLIMPVLFLAIRCFGTMPVLVTSLLLSIAASVGMNDSISGTWQASLHFLWMFVLGMTIAIHRRALLDRLVSWSRWQFAMAVVLALGLMAVPFSRVWADFAIAPGAGLLIALTMHPSVGRRMQGVRPLRWLGQISYSLYLVHLPILVILVSYTDFSPSIILVISLAAAHLAYLGIEKPAQQLGSLLGRMICIHRDMTLRVASGGDPV